MIFKIKSFLLCLHELLIRRPSDYPHNCPDFIPDIDNPTTLDCQRVYLESCFYKPSYDGRDCPIWDDPLA